MTFWSNSFYSLHQSIQHGTNDSRYCDSRWLHFFQGKVNTQETEYTKEGSIYSYKIYFFYSKCYKNHKDCISIILIWLKVRKLICIILYFKLQIWIIYRFKWYKKVTITITTNLNQIMLSNTLFLQSPFLPSASLTSHTQALWPRSEAIPSEGRAGAPASRLPLHHHVTWLGHHSSRQLRFWSQLWELTAILCYHMGCT